MRPRSLMMPLAALMFLGNTCAIKAQEKKMNNSTFHQLFPQGE